MAKASKKRARDSKGRYLVGHDKAGPGRSSMYDPSMNEQARKLALLGLTDEEMAVFFGVTERTFNNWKSEFPAFFQSVNEGKVQADAEVAASLYRRAIGEVTFVERRVKTKDGDYEIVRLSQSVPADPGAAKLWLTNRQPGKWREKTEVALNGAITHDHNIKAVDLSDDELADIAKRGGS